MAPTETAERGSTPDAAVPEQPPPERDRLVRVLIVGLGGILTAAWLCVLALLALWFIRAVL